MEKPVIKNILKLVVDVAILISIFFALGEHFYNSMENYFIDKVNSLFGTSSISPFTSKVNIAASVVCLIDIPYEIFSIIKKDQIDFRGLFVAKYIVSVSLTITFVSVLFVIFPFTCISTKSFIEALKINYYAGNLVTHIMIPLLFVISFIFLEKKSDLNTKTAFFSGIPVVFYAFVYVFLVYVFKTWEDIYYTKEIIKYITIFGMVFLILFLFAATIFTGYILKKIKKAR